MIARLSSLVALMLCLAGNARGDISPIAQLRIVAASGSLITMDENPNFYDSVTAPDFGPFDDATGLALRNQIGTASADGFTNQVSHITPKEIYVYASADAFVSASNMDDAAYAAASSVFSVRFTVDEPSLYHLQAEGYAQNNGTAFFRLSDVDSNSIVEFDPAQSAPLDLQIYLAPGEYGMHADANASGFFEWGTGAPDGRSGITASLTQVPEPSTLALLAIAVTGGATLARRQRVKSG